MATVQDVADEAGVSAMTVSRFFNHPHQLSPDTKERVREAVEALQYVPNQTARSLTSGETKTVALILADITNPFFTQVARGAEDAAQAAGYALILSNTDETPSKEQRYINVLVSRQIDGVLLAPHDGGDRVQTLRQHDVPVVLIDRRVPGADVDTLTTDSADGSRQLVTHLREQGYRRIGFVGGHPDISSLEERLAGYRDAMQAAGLTPDVHLGAYSVESGETITEELIASDALPDAIIAANNLVAVGCVSTLRRHDRHVPDDVALACFGDLELTARIDPFLTVIAQPAYELGRRAMEQLIERMEGSTDPAGDTVLPVELIARRSTAPHPRSAEVQ